MHYGRMIFVISMLTVGGIYGGGWGVFAMFLLSALILIPFAGPQEARTGRPSNLPTPDTWDTDEAVTGARKGTAANPDPTRPTPDDYAAMITDNYGHRRK